MFYYTSLFLVFRILVVSCSFTTIANLRFPVHFPPFLIPLLFYVLNVRLLLLGALLPALSIYNDYPPPHVTAPLKATLHLQGIKLTLSLSFFKNRTHQKTYYVCILIVSRSPLGFWLIDVLLLHINMHKLGYDYVVNDRQS